MSAGTWSPAGELPSAQAHFGVDAYAVVLADGRVLVAGGAYPAGKAVADAALFDPATGTWSATSPMREARRIHSVTLLPDRRVLVAGGQPGPIVFPQRALASAELYDPATGTWSATGTRPGPQA